MKKPLFALVAALLLASCSGKPAQTEPEGIKTVDFKDYSITWIRDTPEESPKPVRMFPDATPELLESLGLTDMVASSMSAFYMKCGDNDILFDAGMGSKDAQLVSGLAYLGKTPEDIDYIFITHLHGDHIGGLVNDGKVVFPKAKIYLSAPEYASWAEKEDPSADKQAAAVMELYKDQLNIFNFGDVLPCDIKSISAIGHTPGHTAYEKGKVLVVGDIMHGSPIQIADPTICASFDGNKEQSVQTRIELIDYAKENKMLMLGMHLPDPGMIDYR